MVTLLLAAAVMQASSTPPARDQDKPATIEESVTVTATRTERRIEDEPVTDVGGRCLAASVTRADSVSGDVTWRQRSLEITGTVFFSRVRDALMTAETGDSQTPIAVVNAPGPTTTRGTEFITRYHREDLDVILRHMFLWATEPDASEPIEGRTVNAGLRFTV